MSTTNLSKDVDRVLGPLGFERRARNWIRATGGFFDLVDLQVSKAGDSVTVNAGVLDPAVFVECWGDAAPTPLDETSCTVRARVGQLMADEKDLWWSVDDTETPDRVADALRERVVPFLDSMHSRQAMADWLNAQGVVRQKYPVPIVYLAILLRMNGDTSAACSILVNLQRSAVGGWKSRVGEILARFECQ